MYDAARPNSQQFRRLVLRRATLVMHPSGRGGRARSLHARQPVDPAAPRSADSPLRRPPYGSADAAFGIREFVVGTGRAGSTGFGTIRAGIRLRDFQRRRDG